MAIVARPRRGGAQAGRPVRPVPGARRHRRRCCSGRELIDWYASVSGLSAAEPFVESSQRCTLKAEPRRPSIDGASESNRPVQGPGHWAHSANAGHLHGMGLLNSKTRSVVGLDIEPGFVAAAEFSRTADARRSCARPPRASAPASSTRARSSTSTASPTALKAFFREHELPKRVRLGVASQKIARPRARAAGDRQRAGARGRDPLPGAGGASDAARAGGARPPRAGAHRRRRGRPHARPRRGRPPRQRRAPAGGRAQGRPAARAGRPLRLRDDPRALRAAAAAVAADGARRSADVRRRSGVRSPTAQASSRGGRRIGRDRRPPTPDVRATLYCYVGGLTNLAIGVGQNCVFNRVLQNGVESMAATLAERRGLTLDHSREWLRYVGLERDIDGSRASARSSRRRARCSTAAPAASPTRSASRSSTTTRPFPTPAASRPP